MALMTQAQKDRLVDALTELDLLAEELSDFELPQSIDHVFMPLTLATKDVHGIKVEG